MLTSMTGFARGQGKIGSMGKITIELRSSNHKFLEVLLQLPEGLRFLEEKIKKEIESKAKRGRIICGININPASDAPVFINSSVLKSYVLAIRDVSRKLRIKDGVGLSTLLNLPGVISSRENLMQEKDAWPPLEKILRTTVENFTRMRKKEGSALEVHLRRRAVSLKSDLSFVAARFQKVIHDKAASIVNEDERASFLKDADITEELERLAFHAQNFIKTMAKAGPVGKELDFITQEMQREANTIGAKSCDKFISAKVVEIKSQVEKMREQLQNIE